MQIQAVLFAHGSAMTGSAARSNSTQAVRKANARNDCRVCELGPTAKPGSGNTPCLRVSPNRSPARTPGRARVTACRLQTGIERSSQ